MTIPFRRTRIASVIVGLALALAGEQALGAGFALQENSGSGVGNAQAGGAAAAEDASTIWANPAGMSRIGTNQVVGALHLINVSMKFSNGNSLPAGCYAPACNPPVYQTLGGDGGDAGSLNFVPNLYFVAPLNKQWAFGIGVNAPFGLVTEYDSSWLGRFQGIKSDIKTMNINPALSWKLADNFAIGAGADYQQIKATLTKQVNYSGALLQAAYEKAGIPPGSATFNAIAQATPGLESHVHIKGDDWAWGWNVGALWDVDRNNRIGAHYRSSIKYNVSGNVDFCNPGQPGCQAFPAVPPSIAALAAGVNNLALYNGGVTSNIKLPEIINVSYFGKLNDRWDLMADAQYTGWNTIQDLTFYRTNGALLGTTPENWDNVWKIAVGANYRYDDKWKFRGGVAYDWSPVSEAYRTPRLPDDSRVWLAAGAQYKMDRQWAFEFGVTYGWAPGSVPIHQNDGSTPANGLIDGTYKVNFLIGSGQVTYSF